MNIFCSVQIICYLTKAITKFISYILNKKIDFFGKCYNFLLFNKTQASEYIYF